MYAPRGRFTVVIFYSGGGASKELFKSLFPHGKDIVINGGGYLLQVHDLSLSVSLFLCVSLSLFLSPFLSLPFFLSLSIFLCLNCLPFFIFLSLLPSFCLSLSTSLSVCLYFFLYLPLSVLLTLCLCLLHSYPYM